MPSRRAPGALLAMTLGSAILAGPVIAADSEKALQSELDKYDLSMSGEELGAGRPRTDKQCEGDLLKAKNFVLGWDRLTMDYLLQAVKGNPAKRKQFCQKIAYGGGTALPTGGNIQRLDDNLASVRGCIQSCSTDGCLEQRRDLANLANLACTGLGMLGCYGGLPSSLRESCQTAHDEISQPGATVLGVSGPDIHTAAAGDDSSSTAISPLPWIIVGVLALAIFVLMVLFVRGPIPGQERHMLHKRMLSDQSAVAQGTPSRKDTSHTVPRSDTLETITQEEARAQAEAQGLRGGAAML